MNPFDVFFAVIGVIAVLVVLLILLGRWRHARRAAAVRAWAERHGYQYSEEEQLQIGELPLFRDGAEVFFYNIVRGQMGGLAFTLFDLRQRWTDPKNAYNLLSTVVSFCEPAATLGLFTVRTGLLRHVFERLVAEDVEIPGADPQFKHRYCVTSKFPDLARAVLTPVVTQVIADTPGHFAIDAEGNYLAIHRPMGDTSSGGNYRVPAKHLDEFLAAAERIGGAILRAAAKAQAGG